MLNDKIIKKIILLACFIFLLFFPALIVGYQASAADLTFTPNVSIGGEFGQPGTPVKIDTQTLGKYISAWYSLIVGVIGILATVMVMYGGFRWLTSGGGAGKNEAKDIILSALVGLVLAFLSYTILYLINPNLLTIGLPEIKGIQYDKNYEASLTEPEWAMSGGTPNGPGGASPCSGGSAVGGVDFTSYAQNPDGTTDCGHVDAVRNAYNQMDGKVNNAADAQQFIDRYGNGESPITGEMVMQAAQANNVEPEVLLAEMAQDSSMGTAGMAERTNNPGNVGNWPVNPQKPSMHTGTNNPCTSNNPCTGTNRYGGNWVDNGSTHETTYPSWDAGVNACAQWLDEHPKK